MFTAQITHTLEQRCIMCMIKMQEATESLRLCYRTYVNIDRAYPSAASIDNGEVMHDITFTCSVHARATH